jgi:hypothetical protein
MALLYLSRVMGSLVHYRTARIENSSGVLLAPMKGVDAPPALAIIKGVWEIHLAFTFQITDVGAHYLLPIAD